MTVTLQCQEIHENARYTGLVAENGYKSQSFHAGSALGIRSFINGMCNVQADQMFGKKTDNFVK